MVGEGRGRGRPGGRRRGGEDPRPVGASLPDAARLLGAEGAFALAGVAERWPDLVGAQVAAHCRPLSLGDGVLTVVTDNNAWASQLRILALDLVANIRSVEPGVQSIAVRVSRPGGRGW